jgi:hypothetical protein
MTRFPGAASWCPTRRACFRNGRDRHNDELLAAVSERGYSRHQRLTCYLGLKSSRAGNDDVGRSGAVVAGHGGGRRRGRGRRGRGDRRRRGGGRRRAGRRRGCGAVRAGRERDRKGRKDSEPGSNAHRRSVAPTMRRRILSTSAGADDRHPHLVDFSAPDSGSATPPSRVRPHPTDTNSTRRLPCRRSSAFWRRWNSSDVWQWGFALVGAFFQGWVPS